MRTYRFNLDNKLVEVPPFKIKEPIFSDEKIKEFIEWANTYCHVVDREGMTHPVFHNVEFVNQLLGILSLDPGRDKDKTIVTVIDEQSVIYVGPDYILNEVRCKDLTDKG
jgi:hypothetical protein